jgi:hypothetical protein
MNASPTPTIVRADATQRGAIRRAENAAQALDEARDFLASAQAAVDEARAELAAALSRVTETIVGADIGSATFQTGGRTARLEATYRPASVSTISATERHNKARRCWSLVLTDPDGAERRIRCELAEGAE